MYQIAVPSYKRVKTLKDKTYKLLLNHKLLSATTIFVVPEELDAYKAEFPDVRVVAGVPGLIQQRRFISSYFPQGTHLMMMDDDLKEIIGMDKKPIENLHELITRGFALTEEHGCRLWGITAVSNPFYMKPEPSTNLKFIVGCFYGFRHIGEEPFVPLTIKEDYYRSCAYYKADKKIIRINSVAPITKFYTEPGGLQETRTDALELEGAQRVVSDFPMYATLYTRKRTGTPELRLREKKQEKTKPSV